jgi:hypothetical protein
MIADRKREARKTEKPEYQTKVPKEDRRKKGKSKTGMDGINEKGLQDQEPCVTAECAWLRGSAQPAS